MTRIATSPLQNAAVQRPKKLLSIIFLIMRPLAQNTSERTPLSGRACVATPAVALSMPFPLSRKLHSCLDTPSDSIQLPSLFRARGVCLRAAMLWEKDERGNINFLFSLPCTPIFAHHTHTADRTATALKFIKMSTAASRIIQSNPIDPIQILKYQLLRSYVERYLTHNTCNYYFQ